jgi:PAS domain-containing protein
MRDHQHPEVQAEKYVVFVDSARRYTDCSDDVCQLLGYDRPEILNKTIDDLSFDRASASPLFEKYVREGLQDGEYILKDKAGEPVLIRYRAWVFTDHCHAAAWTPAEEWEQLYLAALLELNLDELVHKINLALGAIKRRELTLNGHYSEIRQKLRDANSALRALLPR